MLQLVALCACLHGYTVAAALAFFMSQHIKGPQKSELPGAASCRAPIGRQERSDGVTEFFSGRGQDEMTAGSTHLD